ncbi:MAG: hypothetical protein CVT72_01935 [Alphaproteobacteria bacterium HGW-Alphaproteobacteria-11]|nr:MAG: hypothetical protein CVT72_01935 [Alphaproteobacteria bacterium HGW-Alphaproteobacteria-11]
MPIASIWRRLRRKSTRHSFYETQDVMRRAVELAALEEELRGLDDERLRQRLAAETDAAHRRTIERERARRETSGRSPASGTR